MNKAEIKLKDKMRKALKRSQMTKEEKEKEKATNRERIAAKRSHLSEEERDNERAANRKRNAIKRSQMTEAEREIAQAKDRDRKNKKNTISKEEEDFKEKYKFNEEEYNRLYKQRIRAGRSDAEHEYEIVKNLISMRCMRNSRMGKDHLLDNLDARRGMRKLKEEGRLRSFQERSFRELTEIDIWRRFVQRGKDYTNVLKIKSPKLAAYIEEMLEKEVKERIEKYERERQKEKEREDKGYWHMNPDGDVWWTGKEPPGEYDFNPYVSHPVGDGWQGEMELTDKEWEELQAKWYQETVKERKEEERLKRNEVARENYHKRKEELLRPISIPDMEISEYERIRENNIRERNDALKAAGWSM